MCDKAVDRCFLYLILSLINISLTKYLTLFFLKSFTALYADENILYFNKDFSNVTFCCNKMGILSVNLKKINLDYTNYEENGPGTIILIKRLALHIKFEKHKTLKKKIYEELVFSVIANRI